MQRARNLHEDRLTLLQVLTRKQRLQKLIRALVLSKVLLSLYLRHRPLPTDLETAISDYDSIPIPNSTETNQVNPSKSIVWKGNQQEDEVGKCCFSLVLSVFLVVLLLYVSFPA